MDPGIPGRFLEGDYRVSHGMGGGTIGDTRFNNFARRIPQGPVPLDEAIPIARQIAEALPGSEP